MTATIARLSPYQNRLKLVEEVLTAHKKVDATTASDLAVQILHAIDSIPEKVR